jgi:hypothetical protein
MISLQSYLIAALVVEGAALALCDRGMKRNRAEGVSEDEVLWAPLYWEKPELFTPRGNVYRRGALLTMVLGIVTLLGVALTNG